MSFNSVLIANRGEIAVRIIRSAKALGFHTVAVYSDADSNALHVKTADTAINIGGGAAADSYLNIDAILQAASTTGAQAIHPGYGFLAENADFAQAVAKAGLIFIGPSAEAINAMGNKAAAKAMMEDAGVPIIPGYRGEQSDDALVKAAEKIGLPIMVKAAAGGGGRGMRRVAEAGELKNAIQAARSEAQNAFGSGELILEKALDGARHVEVQIFADQHGNTVHLGERDCSVQRRHQKLIEESPSPAVDKPLREKMGDAAVNAAKAVNYQGAGTVEFLLDANGEFYFLEMNTRLQVEHPVTELVTGLDLVEWQLRVANSEPLALTQQQISFTGHAIEVRLCAEDPYADFLPQAGPVLLWSEPSARDIRLDHCLQTGVAISPYYDSMQGKLIAYGNTRDDALRKLRQALNNTSLLGTRHNFDFLANMLAKPSFTAGKATTAFIGEEYPDAIEQQVPGFHKTLAAALCHHLKAQQLWNQRGIAAELQNWSSAGVIAQSLKLELNGEPLSFTLEANEQRYVVSLGDKANEVHIASANSGTVHYQCNGRSHTGRYAVLNEQLWLHTGGCHACYIDPTALQQDAGDSGDDTVVRAPMDGKLLAIKAAVGDPVEKGQLLAVLEAMKMEHQLSAPCSGHVAEVNASANQQISAGARLIEINPEPESN